MKMAPCPASSGSWQVLEVLGDGGSGEGPSFKKGFPPKMHFHRNHYRRLNAKSISLRVQALSDHLQDPAYVIRLADHSLGPCCE